MSVIWGQSKGGEGGLFQTIHMGEDIILIYIHYYERSLDLLN